MAEQIFLNNATTITRGHLSTSATSVVVNDTAPFPTALTNGDWFLATLDGGGNYFEIIKVTAVSGNIWTVVRAQENTTAKLWQPNSRVECRVTAGSLNVLADDVQRGNGSPEGVVTAPVGTLYIRLDGGVSTTLYTKESGVGNTGWAPLVSTSGATFTGAITPHQTLGIVGTTTNNNANAGSVGEYQTNTTFNVAMSNGVITNVTTLPLTAGDWDVDGGFVFSGSGGALITNTFAGASGTSVTFGPAGTFYQFLNSSVSANAAMAGAIPSQRFSLAAPATIFGIGYTEFSAGTVTCTLRLNARRMR